MRSSSNTATERRTYSSKLVVIFYFVCFARVLASALTTSFRRMSDILMKHLLSADKTIPSAGELWCCHMEWVGSVLVRCDDRLPRVAAFFTAADILLHCSF